MNTNSSPVDMHALDRINDDLHWLLLICGHIITEEHDSDEQKTMPEAIMNFSTEQIKYCDLKKSIQIVQHVLQQLEFDLTNEVMRDVASVTQW